MSRSRGIFSSLILALAAGVAVPRSASAGAAEDRLVAFAGWTLRLFTPPDPCSPPDPCMIKLQTEIAPRQHADLIQSFLFGRHTDRGRVFHPEFQLATQVLPPDPCKGDATCSPPGPPVDQGGTTQQPPGPPTKLAVRFDVVDAANAAVSVTVPSGFTLQPSVDANGGTAYTLAPDGRCGTPSK